MPPKRQATLRPPLERKRKAPEKSKSKTLSRPPDKSKSQSTSSKALPRVHAREALLTPKDRLALDFNLLDFECEEDPRGSHTHRKRDRSSSSSTSHTSEGKRDSRKLTKRNQHSRLSRNIVTGVMERSDLTLLEHAAIGAQCRKMYAQEIEEFKRYGDPRGLDFQDASLLDRLLVDYMNKMYLKGLQSYKADRLIAAVLHNYPDYGRNGSRNLPRVWRAIKGFRKLCPGKSRLAYPLAVWCAIATRMKQLGRLRMALFLVVAISSYARPSELLRLRVFSLVRPSHGVTSSWALLLSPEERPERSKTGDYDVSIALDSPWLTSWSGPLFKILKENHPEEELWDFDYSEYTKIFRKVTKELGIEQVTPYQTRHSGPSIDRARGYRTQSEVQKRGQWKAVKSVMRYEKAARLAATFNALPNDLQLHCRLCEESLGEIMLGRKGGPIYGGVNG